MINVKTFLNRTTPVDKTPKPVGEKEMDDGMAGSIGTAAQTLSVPIYYEAWGGIESANRALWTALWFSISVSLLAFILLRVQLRRPPVVILLTTAGQTQVVENTASQPPVSAAEIKNFLALFERFFTELDFYTYNSSLDTAFSMMTPEFKLKAKDTLSRQGVIEKLKADEIKTKLTLTDISIIKDTSQLLECDVKGWREIGSFKTDGPHSELVFEDEIILKKVPRSDQAPDGVLVEDWSESIFKK